MAIKWLMTTAVALMIGTGAVIAQSQSDMQQKREEGTRAQTPSKDAERPAAGEQRSGDHMKGRAEQTEPRAGTKELQRGETASPGERKQAQEPSREPSREAKEPTRQSQGQSGRDRPAATQQSQDEQKGRDAKQATESKQRPGEQQRPENRATDEKRPADAKQQQGQRQQERDRNDQTSQPSGTSTQQSARPGETRQDQRQGQQTGQTRDQSAERGGTSSRVTVNDDQRRQIVDRLRSDRTASSENVNIRVNVGERLPPNVRPRPLPEDIVRIAPQYRDYEYTVIEDRVAVIDPRTRDVVDILDESGPGYGRTARYDRERVIIVDQEREVLRQAARRMTTVGSTSTSGGASGSTCLSLQPVPEELVRNHPELSSYRVLAIGDDMVLVDPQQQKVVQVID